MLAHASRQDPGEPQHYSDRAPWLRAAVLGANDGLVSVSSIMLGVGAGSSDRHTLLLSGLSALVAGALQRNQAQRSNIGCKMGCSAGPRAAQAMDCTGCGAACVGTKKLLCLWSPCEAVGTACMGDSSDLFCTHQVTVRLPPVPGARAC